MTNAQMMNRPQLNESRIICFTCPPSRTIFSRLLIAKHFPAMQDRLAWLSLLSHCEPVGFCGDFLDLRRAAEPLAIQKVEVLDRTLAFDEQLSLPDEPPLGAEVQFNFNSLGRLA